ncbi:hypothetical protein CSB45_04795 [candidate division KSB3 bacterium]|uniref:Methyltransferase type 11 domain-containing protein n=1 Tax=candidate division KSB3 bacterium TaxID=2044937 RepID=A0A2G6E7D9_9BACT|nr:MAG: hypothetical protein CSB45_04795 [candidate division KSB3 bacterium]PIE30374.1 MAG: hypothetical protein CSA57_03565 [candidate division KSB3 bacterium]
MSASQDRQHTQQSHLHFQMWDTYLNRLNTLWSVEYHDAPLHSERVAAKPSSLKEKILSPVKKFIVRTVQPLIEHVGLRQDRMLDAQREFNAATVQSVNGLVELIDEDLKSIRQEVSAQFQTFQQSLDTFQLNLEAFQQKLDMFQEHFERLQSFIDNRLEQIEPRIEAFDTAIWTFERRKEALEIDHILLNQKLGQLADAFQQQLSESDACSHLQQVLSDKERQDDYRYLVFENLHRGDERDIQRRLTGYMQYYENCSAVLDVGCGRGEFLELLTEHQIESYGIDTNRTMVHYCRHKGLQAQEADVISHLEALPDDSLGGIFIAHLVEHLTLDELQQVLRLCFAKLQPHKYLILETPNPQSLYTLSHHFYKDLSHRNPLDPEALLHLVNSSGFEEARIEVKNPFPDGISHAKLLQKTKVEQLNDRALQEYFETLNQNMQQLNDIIYGYLDYAIISRKIRTS